MIHKASGDGIKQSLSLSRPFLLLKALFNAILDVLDRFRLGVFLLTPSGDIVTSNQSAHHILEDKDGISVDVKKMIETDQPQRPPIL